MSKSSPARASKRTAAKKGLASLRAQKALKEQADEALRSYLTAAMQTVKFVADEYTGIQTPATLLEAALQLMDAGFRKVQETERENDISGELRELVAAFKAAPASPQADGEG